MREEKAKVAQASVAKAETSGGAKPKAARSKQKEARQDKPEIRAAADKIESNGAASESNNSKLTVDSPATKSQHSTLEAPPRSTAAGDESSDDAPAAKGQKQKSRPSPSPKKKPRRAGGGNKAGGQEESDHENGAKPARNVKSILTYVLPKGEAAAAFQECESAPFDGRCNSNSFLLTKSAALLERKSKDRMEM